MTIDKIAALGEKLQQAPNAEAHWDCCAQAFEDLGVTSLGYAVIPMASEVQMSGATNAAFFRHTYGKEWERAISSEEVLDYDITTKLLLSGVEEVYWQDDATEFGGTEKNKRLWELEQDLGIVWGKTLLLSHHSKNTVSSGIGMHVTAVRSEAEFEKYWTKHRQQLRVIGEMLNHGMLHEHTDGLVRLTGREKDYLYWAAMGLDRIETAHRLGISEHTLNKPIASAKAKLKARSTSQAVAKAVLLGLIDL